MNFNFLLSIGFSCQPRYQIERIQKKRNPEHKQKTMFFDSLMCGGIAGVTKIIESNFYFDPSDFSAETIGTQANHIPLHRSTGFRFLHDLGCSVESRKTEAAALECMHQNMDSFISKYQYLGQRTDDLLRNTKSVGLVYHGTIPTTHCAEMLLDVLNEKYQKEFQIFNVMEIGKENPINLPHVTSLTIDNSRVQGSPNAWMGDDESWDQAFKNIKTY